MNGWMDFIFVFEIENLAIRNANVPRKIKKKLYRRKTKTLQHPPRSAPENYFLLARRKTRFIVEEMLVYGSTGNCF